MPVTRIGFGAGVNSSGPGGACIRAGCADRHRGRETLQSRRHYAVTTAGITGSWAEKPVQAQQHYAAGPSALAEAGARRRMGTWQHHAFVPAVLSPA